MTSRSIFSFSAKVTAVTSNKVSGLQTSDDLHLLLYIITHAIIHAIH